MPLRDHFRSTSPYRRYWEMIHGGWPMVITQHLDRVLPRGYSAGPRVHLGTTCEIDVAAFEGDEIRLDRGEADAGGGTATALWSPAKPALTLETELSEPPEYEVLVYDRDRGETLVAAIELVSPANKDRPEHRQAFVAKCLALLQQHVCVVIVDPVTDKHFNFYADLLDLIGCEDPTLGTEPPSIYAVTCRTRTSGRRPLLDVWPHALELGHPLPTLPLWLSEELAVPLDLEQTYEDTCRVLRIA